MGRGRGWQSHWDYCGGQLADDGSHVIDLARMAMDDPGHPKSVYCLGGRMAYNDAREVPDMQQITYDFGDFVYSVTCSEFTPYMKKTSGDIRRSDKFPYWPQNSTRTEIYGTKRMMYLGRHGGGWQVFEGDQKVADFRYGYFPDDAHHKNFIECVRSRKQSNGNPLQGHLSATLVHLGNISYRAGNKHLVFDAETETFPNNSEANKFLKPQYRKNYRIPDEV
jgi:predicted dehydrogenase